MSDKTRPTHWMDDRGFSVTDDWLKNDPHSTSDYRAAYNIPCVKKRGKIVPIETPDPQPVPHAQVASEVTDEHIETLAHRMAWRYKKSSDPHHSDTYTFNRTTLIDFVRAALAAQASGPDQAGGTQP